MGLRSLVVFTLCVLGFVSAEQMASNSTSGSGSGSETVAQLLADVQAAVADDPALANMFDISSASKMSEAELTTLLEELLTVSLSGSSSSSSSSSTTTSASAESTQSASAAGSTVSSDASTVALSSVVALAVAALGATL
ncbi:hypothetical protein PHMEG_00030734 [Phytophthora megakarya]|uniref:RxLR effector protein n=1 Tax=Phytophthora megakarya TaxID=4795 RepID=A0A225UZP8_9STRA|nr:hypothetical protein PHMEG_00030734 [Phytophthora megakarya]